MRKLLATMLAVIMNLCVALCASACGGANAPAPSDPDRTETDPSGNGNGNNDDEDDDPYAKYSNILKTVLTSSYYKQKIEDYSETRMRTKVCPIPYKLLTDLGIDIDKNKNTQIGYTTSYIKGTDTSKLYVSAQVVNKDATPYYHCITACYELNEKEYADLEMLHRNQYVQAPLFIQELSYQKEPINYTYSKITVDSYEKLYRVFRDNTNLSLSVLGTQNITLDFNSFDLSTQTFEATIRTSKQQHGLIGSGKMGHITMYPVITSNTITTDANDPSIFVGPTFYWNTSLEDYKNSLENVTYFSYLYDNVLYTNKLK